MIRSCFISIFLIINFFIIHSIFVSMKSVEPTITFFKLKLFYSVFLKPIKSAVESFIKTKADFKTFKSINSIN